MTWISNSHYGGALVGDGARIAKGSDTKTRKAHNASVNQPDEMTFLQLSLLLVERILRNALLLRLEQLRRHYADVTPVFRQQLA